MHTEMNTIFLSQLANNNDNYIITCAILSFGSAIIISEGDWYKNLRLTLSPGHNIK